jgi:RHS repeat-associated protein
LTLASGVAGNVTDRYLYGKLIDEVLADRNSIGVNRQGSVKLVVDSQGGVVDRVSYDSFGNKVADGNSNYDFRFGFTGRELDSETNQYYYRARYYDPSVGRFISTDPIGLESGDTNLYRYVFNSPTQFTDPTGNMWDLGQAWNNFTGGVQNTWNAVSTGAQNLGTSIQSGVQNFGANIQSGINNFSTSAGEAWNNAGSYIKEGFDAIGAATSAVINTGSQFAGQVWNKAGDAVYEAAFAADQLIAGFADVVSLGATTRIRESLYGDWVKSQHQGALFKTGQILGVGALVIVSAGAGGLAAGGGAGARLAATMVRSGVNMGLAGMGVGAGLGASSSLANDLDHGGLNWGSFGRALDGGFNGAIEGFKGGTKFGALAPLGVAGQIIQAGMAFNDLKESAETTVGHLERGEYWSAAVSVIGLVDSTKDAYHAGTKAGNSAKSIYNARQQRNTEVGLTVQRSAEVIQGEIVNTHTATSIPDGWVRLPDGTIQATPNRMLPAAQTSPIITDPSRILPPAKPETVNPTQCFVAGTEILTRDGTKNIENIQVGDWVLSDDPNTVGEIEYKQVLQTFAKTATTMIDLYIDGEKITTTEEHPFWVPEVGWVAAKDLTAGTYLQTKTESWLDIDRVDRHIEDKNVYNFEVEGFHTYFVSELGFLVHNTCDADLITNSTTPNHWGSEDNIILLWRAVLAPELEQINKTNMFQTKHPGYGEVKYFSDSPESAASYAKQAYEAWPNDGSYTIVETAIPKTFVESYMRSHVDGNVPAIVLPEDLLPYLNPPTVLNSSPITGLRR